MPGKPTRAVVTGAGSGLGRAIAVELGARGASVLVADINLDTAEETARLLRDRGAKAHACACDVAKWSEVESLAAEAERVLGAVDFVANNAGVAVGGPFEKIPLQDWEWIMGINLWGVIYGCRAFLPGMRDRGRGHLLNVASSAGLISVPEMSPYNVTKSAVVALSETIAGELRGTGVGITVLCPTFFRTNIARSGRSHADGTDMVERIEKLMGRASIQADGVAKFALDTAERGKLYALPHADGRTAWRVKRTSPELFQSTILPNVFQRIKKRG